jgi:uncharacterized membrane protein YbhN (UPF0104 family)
MMLFPKAKPIVERLIIGIAFLFIIHYMSQGWAMIANQIHQTRWWILGWAGLAFLGYFLIRATAWWLMLKSLKAELPYSRAARI